MAETLSFVVQKTCRVQLDDRSIVVCHPGDPLPERAVLSNPRLWIDSGYLIEKDNRFVPKRPYETTGVISAEGAPPPAFVPKPGEPIGAGMAPAPEPESAPLADDDEEDGDEVTPSRLKVLTKLELISLGEEVGVDLEMSMKKSEMIEALLKSQD